MFTFCYLGKKINWLVKITNIRYLHQFVFIKKHLIQKSMKDHLDPLFNRV